MRFLLIALLAVAITASEVLITPQYLNYLRSVVDWEVVEYEESIFKGWTLDEIKQLLGDEGYPEYDNLIEAEVTNDIPSSINWAGANCIHDIHNQGSCGSCWAFAASSVLSDKCCLGSKDYGWLSPQELVNCDKSNSGCNGGLAGTAFQYTKKNGLVDDKCLSYKAKNGACPSKCEDGRDWKAAHVCKHKEIIDCSGLEKVKSCIKDGPIAVRLIVHSDFMSYKSGIYCYKAGGILGGHAVRCTGYSTDPKEHLICANSWGTNWGEKGYFKIEPLEKCGIRMTPQSSFTVSGF